MQVVPNILTGKLELVRPWMMSANGNIYYTSGNVGIGTTTPNEELVVVGNVNITENVKIGTPSASIFKAEINSDTIWASSMRNNLRLSSDSNPTINLYHESDDKSVVLAGVGNGGLRIYTGGSGTGLGTNQFQLDISGNLRLYNGVIMASGTGNHYIMGKVGIGTTNPKANLHIMNTDTEVTPDSGGNNLVVENNGDAGISILGGNSAGDYSTIYFGSPNGNRRGGVVYQNSGDILYLRAYDKSRVKIDGTRFIINEDGDDVDTRIESSNNANMLFIDGGTDRVGIGTGSPDATLQVVGDSKFGDDNTNYLSVASDGELTLTGTARVEKLYWIGANGIKAPGAKPATFVEDGLTGCWEFDDAIEANQESVSGTVKA